MAKSPANAASADKSAAAIPAADGASETSVPLPNGETLTVSVAGGAPASAASVRLLSASSARDVPAGSLIVVCREPGFRRAGIAHPQIAVYPIGTFTDAQMTQLVVEPMLELIEVTA